VKLRTAADGAAKKRVACEGAFVALAFWSANAAVRVLLKPSNVLLVLLLTVAFYGFFRKAWALRPAVGFCAKRGGNPLFWLGAFWLSTFFAFGLMAHNRTGAFFADANLLRVMQELAQTGGLILLSFFVVIAAVGVVARFQPKAGFPQPPLRRRWFFVFCGGIVLPLLVYYLIVFPGTITPDSYEQVRQFESGVLSNWHPILHTLFVGALNRIGNGSAVPYMLVQMVIYTFVAAYAVWWNAARTRSRFATACAWIWLALHPVIMGAVVSRTKDTLFSAAVLLLVIELSELASRPGEGKVFPHLALLAVAAFFVCFLRNNGALILLLLLVAALFFLSEKKQKHVTAGIFAGVLVIFSMAQVIVLPALRVRQTPITEALAVPLQQVGKVVKNERALTAQEEVALAKIMPLDAWRATYETRGVDAVKFNSDFNGTEIQENPRSFFRLWWKLFLRYPGDYVTAALEETVTLWDPLFVSPSELAAISAVQTSPNSIGLYQFVDYFTVFRRAFWSPTLLLCAEMLIALVLLLRKQRRQLLPFVVIAGLYLSLAATMPMGDERRYTWPVVFCLPVLLAGLFASPERHVQHHHDGKAEEHAEGCQQLVILE
jgi:hypothetical protein